MPRTCRVLARALTACGGCAVERLTAGRPCAGVVRASGATCTMQRGTAPVHRGQGGIDSMYAIEKPRRSRSGSAPEAPVSPAAGRGGAKRGVGGGGAGCPRPLRADPMRQRKVGWVPGQKEALELANAQFFSPRRKLAACRHQRSSGTHHETLPLSPVEARPCTTPECFCRMSHSQLALSVPLWSPSQVRHPSRSSRLCATPDPDPHPARERAACWRWLCWSRFGRPRVPPPCSSHLPDYPDPPPPLTAPAR